VLPRMADSASFFSSSSPTSAVADWGRGNSNWLGFEPRGRGGPYKGGGGRLNGEIEPSTRGGHQQRWTWPHGLPHFHGGARG
jgi:hypothetical protein